MSGAGNLDGLSVRRDGAVTTVSFGRSVIDAALVRALQAAIEVVTADESVRVLVLCSAAGGLSGAIAEGACSDLVRAIRSLAPPVVAKVAGSWGGSALALVAACDIAYAADDARFLLAGESPGVRHGATRLAVARVMTARALALHALDGRPFDGLEAERNGLATLSFPAGQLDAETDTLVAGLLAKDALALRFTKQTLRHAPGMDPDAVLDYNAAKFAELKALQAGQPSARAAAVQSFLAGNSKPGLGG